MMTIVGSLPPGRYLHTWVMSHNVAQLMILIPTLLTSKLPVSEGKIKETSALKGLALKCLR